MSEQKLKELKKELLERKGDLEFELFAVGLGVAPVQREKLSSELEVLNAELKSISERLAKLLRKRIEVVPDISVEELWRCIIYRRTKKTKWLIEGTLSLA